MRRIIYLGLLAAVLTACGGHHGGTLSLPDPQPAATKMGVKQGVSEAELRACETVEPCKARLLPGPQDQTPAAPQPQTVTRSRAS